MNGNLYVKSEEVFGILPIPRDVQIEAGMQPHHISLDRPAHHAFLASRQGTRKAVLPVHTPAEYKLFSKLMRDEPTFNQRDGEPDWEQGVRIWNRYAETEDDIYYKVR